MIVGNNLLYWVKHLNLLIYRFYRSEQLKKIKFLSNKQKRMIIDYIANQLYYTNFANLNYSTINKIGQMLPFKNFKIGKLKNLNKKYHARKRLH